MFTTLQKLIDEFNNSKISIYTNKKETLSTGFVADLPHRKLEDTKKLTLLLTSITSRTL